MTRADKIRGLYTRTVIGKTISHYRVIQKIGEGTTGVVYKAEDLALGRPVALKFLPAGLSTEDAAIVRFRHEARMASSLNHPNICTVHEIAEHEGHHFIVMELLEGRTLGSAIGGRPLDFELLLDVGIQLADALDAAHAQSIVHRDLKPANVFITQRGQSKILDFGLAELTRAQGSSSELSGGFLPPCPGGTVPYMSPEQIREEEIDGRSDLFSMGILLFEMATGRRAFNGGTRAEICQAILHQPTPSARSQNRAVPSELDRIIAKALERNRRLRFQTASDLRADLQRLKRDLESSQIQLGTSPAARAKRWTLASAVALGLAIVGMAFQRKSATHVPDVVGPRTAPVVAGPPRPVQPPPPPSAGPSNTSEPPQEIDQNTGRLELRIARSKADAGLYDQALGSLRDVAAKHAQTPEALDAYFLMGAIQASQKRTADAIATYIEMADRFKDHPRAAEAVFRRAALTLSSERNGKESEARALYTDLVQEYPRTPWAPRALLARGEIEQQLKLYERDAVLATSVPTAMITYRQLVGDYPDSNAAHAALARLGSLYEQVKRYDLAAETFATLAMRYPTASSGLWFRVGEIYRRRLKDPDKARAAYLRVEATSPHYEAAQNRLR